MSAENDDPLVDTHEAARMMGLKYNTVVKARIYGGAGACPWVRLGRTIRYRVGDVERHMAGRKHTRTFEY